MRKKKQPSNTQQKSTGIVIEASDRKARRKDKRQAKKKAHQQKRTIAHADTITKKKQKKNRTTSRHDDERSSKRVKFSNNLVQERTIPPIKNKHTTPPALLIKSNKSAAYEHLDDETAASMRRDDQEIEYLESSLGIKRGSKARELNKEYSKNEGFGDDFGDFLMGLDDVVERCMGGGNNDVEGKFSDGSEENEDDAQPGYEQNSEDDESEDDEMYANDDDIYAHLDEDAALALRNDDAEIAELEEKLGLSTSTKAKKKLKKEYAGMFAGYGEDFIDFLDECDDLGTTIMKKSRDGKFLGGDNIGGEEMNSEDEQNDSGDQHDSEGSGSDDDDDDDDSNASDDTVEDHDNALTYRPSMGEDIYGNLIENGSGDTVKPTKYVPPHLRKKLQGTESNGEDGGSDVVAETSSKADPETILQIKRSLNNSLNRLSENTIESVSKALSSLYSEYPFHDINDCVWDNMRLACVPPHAVMSGLIPLYVAAMAGVHWLGGDGIQLGGCIIEWSVRELHESLVKARQPSDHQDMNSMMNKEGSNYLLIVCYLYNYGVVHCTLIYGLVRDLVASFKEVDIEALLLILSHCGQQLRSDDPSALKEIVILVKDQAQKPRDGDQADSSRINFMLDTVMSLKNNKPGKQQAVIREKTNQLKKVVGRIKTAAPSSLKGKKSGSCLRVSLQDILDAETKGRWWMVGASWTGKQHNSQQDESLDIESDGDSQDPDGNEPEKEDKLIALASSQRMNTDNRRAIFCIIMGSTDYDDAFEKLVRAGMLKPKVERDVIRVLVHCCGEEKAFNPFYGYLAMRVCEYQRKSNFTLTLTFWDTFKQMDTFPVRKVANLAKLLALLVGGRDGQYLNIGVLKRIDFTPSEIQENIAIFLTIFMTTLFESSDKDRIKSVFTYDTAAATAPKKKKKTYDFFDSEDEDDDKGNGKSSQKEDLSELRESIAVFLLQYLKSSPKNTEGTQFHNNFCVALKICEETK
eukprot:scaffold719_cov145-Skeletonema_menzelii.AAC.1